MVLLTFKWLTVNSAHTGESTGQSQKYKAIPSVLSLSSPALAAGGSAEPVGGSKGWAYLYLTETRRSEGTARPPRGTNVRKHLSVVYFIRANPSGNTKIGFVRGATAESVANRLATLQVANFEELEVVVAVPGGHERERYFHSLLEESRVRGEWFAPSDELDALVVKLRKNPDYVEHVPEDRVRRNLTFKQAKRRAFERQVADGSLFVQRFGD